MKKAPILLVTGTDTGSGKTLVSALLLRALRDAGKKPAAVKPVETGCVRNDDGSLFAPDVELLSSAAQTPARNVACYEMPVAPQLASELEGPPISVDAIVAAIEDAAKKSDLVLVEGAGGLLVPIVERFTFADLAKRCGASVLVVVGSRLGAINHAALTFEALRGRGLRTAGYVINDLFSGPESEPSAARDTNRELLSRTAAYYELKELAALPFS